MRQEKFTLSVTCAQCGLSEIRDLPKTIHRVPIRELNLFEFFMIRSHLHFKLELTSRGIKNCYLADPKLKFVHAPFSHLKNH